MLSGFRVGVSGGAVSRGDFAAAFDHEHLYAGYYAITCCLRLTGLTGASLAALSTTVRQQIWRGLMRFWSRQLETISGVTKTDLQAAVNAADDWADQNASSFNSALPTAFRNNATAGQKALLLAVVVLARYNAPAIRAIVGEVD